MSKETNIGKSQDDLLKALGINESQIEVKEKTEKTQEINTNADQLKVNLKQSTKDVNAKLGKNISFTALKREGTMKDANGKTLKDENGKDVPRYVKTRMSGTFVIDKTKDGFHRVTRGVQYTESHLVADFVELD